jgi:hypothetical protein
VHLFDIALVMYFRSVLILSCILFTEQATVAVKFYACILDVTGSNLGEIPDIFTEFFVVFLRFSTKFAGLVYRLGHNCFLKNYSEFIMCE